MTTRNPQLSIHAEEDAVAKVADMSPEDAKQLLMQMSRAEKNDENETLAALIVKVMFKFCFILIITFNLIEDLETTLFCIGHLSS